MGRIYEDLKKSRRKGYNQAPATDLCRACRKPTKEVLNPDEGQAYIDLHVHDDSPVCLPSDELLEAFWSGRAKLKPRGDLTTIFGKEHYNPEPKLVLERRAAK